jgi:hypothetical protein
MEPRITSEFSLAHRVRCRPAGRQIECIDADVIHRGILGARRP